MAKIPAILNKCGKNPSFAAFSPILLRLESAYFPLPIATIIGCYQIDKYTTAFRLHLYIVSQIRLHSGNAPAMAQRRQGPQPPAPMAQRGSAGVGARRGP